MSSESSRKENVGVLLTEQLVRSIAQSPAPSEKPSGVRRNLRMRVGIDARVFCFASSMERGIGHYTINHLDAVIRSRPEWEFFFFLRMKSRNEYLDRFLALPNVQACTFDSAPPVDLFHIPDLMSMIAGFDSPFHVAPKGVPLSVIFYDLIPYVRRQEHFDHWSQLTRIAYKKRLERLIHPDVIVLAISEFTKQDLLRHVAIDEARVKPIMAGLNHLVDRAKLPSEAEARAVVRSQKLKEPFFLSVGGLDPHKNFIVSLNAFQALPKELGANLVIVGGFNDPRKQMIEQRLRALGLKSVVFTGYLSNEDLVALYRSASALLFPSAYEGFGFPALEAMACGCPVLCSNAASIPEVVGDAAIQHEPDDFKGLAMSMMRILHEPGLRSQLIEKGFKRSELFTWERTADLTLAAWEEFLTRRQMRTEADTVTYSARS